MCFVCVSFIVGRGQGLQGELPLRILLLFQRLRCDHEEATLLTVSFVHRVFLLPLICTGCFLLRRRVDFIRPDTTSEAATTAKHH